MSADTTNEKVESTTEKTQEVAVKPLMNQTPNPNRNNQRDREHQGQGGFRRGGGGGERGGYNRFGKGRQSLGPYPNNNNAKFEDKKRFRSSFHGNSGNDRSESREIGLMKMQERIMKEKLSEIAGPSCDIQPLDQTEKKFSSRSRLYMGNLSQDITEDELTEMFKKYGEVSELFVNKEKHFGFVRLDYHFNAEKAKNELNGTAIRGKTIKLRFAPNGCLIKIKNLDEFVTNELLHAAFSVFGEVERSVVIVDDRGKSMGEGIIEYGRKNSAMLAVRKCTEHCYFLTATLRPCMVELFDAIDDVDGHSEKNINKKNPEFWSRRNVGPRFAVTDSFEHEYGLRWKNLHEMHQQKIHNLKKELEIDQDKLVAQMELARYEHDTAMLRDQLRVREMDMDRQKKEWEMKEAQVEEARRLAELEMRQQEQDMQARMLHQDEEIRRRQEENKLFIQAQQLDNMLNNQEQAYDGHGADERGGVGNYERPGGAELLTDVGHNNQYEQHFDDGEMRGGSIGGGGGGGYQGGGDYQAGGGNRGGARWNDKRGEQRNDYFKRRRY